MADFVVMKNIVRAEFREKGAFVSGPEVRLEASLINGNGYLAISPEDIVIRREALSSSMRNSFRGSVTGTFDQGFYYEVHLRLGTVPFKSLIKKGRSLNQNFTKVPKSSFPLKRLGSISFSNQHSMKSATRNNALLQEARAQLKGILI